MVTAAELAILIRVRDEASAAIAHVEGKTQALGASMQRVGGQMRTAGLGMTAGLTLPILGFGAAAIKSASDLAESESKANVVFGKYASAVQAFAGTSAEAFGISKQQANEYSATLGNILLSTGLNQEAATGMSLEMVKLAGDLASFNNLDVDVALEKIRAGLVGEVEPLRTVGVTLSEAKVQAAAYTAGIAEQGAKLTEAEKVQARYQVILAETGTAHGDAGRTIGMVAGQTRVLQARFADTSAELGENLIPLTIALMDRLNDGVDVVSDLSEQFEGMDPQLKKIALGFAIGLAAAGPLLFILGSLVSSIAVLISIVVALASPWTLVALAVLAAAAAIALFVIPNEKLPAVLLRVKLHVIELAEWLVRLGETLLNMTNPIGAAANALGFFGKAASFIPGIGDEVSGALGAVRDGVDKVNPAAYAAGFAMDYFEGQAAEARAALAGLDPQLAATNIGLLVTNRNAIFAAQGVAGLIAAVRNLSGGAAAPTAPPPVFIPPPIPVPDLSPVSGAVGEAIDLIALAWAEGARQWMEAVERGVRDGSIRIRDVLRLGLGDAGRSAIAEMARVQDENEEVWRIIGDTVERGIIRIQDVARLLELGPFGAQAAEDFLRGMEGLPSRTRDAIFAKIEAEALKAGMDAAVAFVEKWEEGIAGLEDTLAGAGSKLSQILGQETVESATQRLDILKLQLAEMDAQGAAEAAREARASRIAEIELEINRVRESGAAQIAQLEAARAAAVDRIKVSEGQLSELRKAQADAARILGLEQQLPDQHPLVRAAQDLQAARDKLVELEAAGERTGRQRGLVRRLESQFQVAEGFVEREAAAKEREIEAAKAAEQTIEAQLADVRARTEAQIALLEREKTALDNTVSAEELHLQQLQSQRAALEELTDRRRIEAEQIALQLQLNNGLLPTQAEVNAQAADHIALMEGLRVVYENLTGGIFRTRDATLLLGAGMDDLARIILLIAEGILDPDILPSIGRNATSAGRRTAGAGAGGSAGSAGAGSGNVYIQRLVVDGNLRESLEGLGLSFGRV